MNKRRRESEHGNDLADLMLRIRDELAEDADATHTLRQRVIAIGSATEDNVNCIDHVEIGHVRSLGRPAHERGIKIKGKKILLSDIVGCAEGAQIPKVVRDSFPQ